MRRSCDGVRASIYFPGSSIYLAEGCSASMWGESCCKWGISCVAPGYEFESMKPMNVICAKLQCYFLGYTLIGSILIHPGPWALSRPRGGPVTRSRSCAIPVRFLLDSSVFFYFWLHAQEHQQQHQLLLQHPIRGPIPGPPPLFRAPLLSALIFFPNQSSNFTLLSWWTCARLLTWPVEEYLSCANSRLILRLPSRFLYFYAARNCR